MSIRAQDPTWTSPAYPVTQRRHTAHLPHIHGRAETSRRKWTGVTGITRAFCASSDSVVRVTVSAEDQAWYSEAAISVGKLSRYYSTNNKESETVVCLSSGQRPDLAGFVDLLWWEDSPSRRS